MKVWHWILLIVAALVIIGGGVYWYFFVPKTAKKANTNTGLTAAPVNAGASSLSYSLNSGIVYAGDNTEAGTVNDDGVTWTDDSGNTWALTGLTKLS